jgi:hypothetical protein
VEALLAAGETAADGGAALFAVHAGLFFLKRESEESSGEEGAAAC